MLAVISPAKSLDFDTPPPIRRATDPTFGRQAATLIRELRKLSPGEVSDLMGISAKLGELNCNRYNEWRIDGAGGKQAALAFTGDVYMGLRAWHMDARELSSLQRRVRILSGLYGLLKPLDSIQPYRLEMGTAFANARGRDLYAFWGSRIAHALNAELACHRNKTLVNLASNEYWQAVDPDAIESRVRVLHTRFLDRRNGDYKIISFYAKKARGLMAGYMARQRVETVKGLKAFNGEGYRYSDAHSRDGELAFVRDRRP